MAKRSAKEAPITPSTGSDSESRTLKRRKIATRPAESAHGVVGAIAPEDHEAFEHSSTTAVSEVVYTFKKTTQSVKRKAKSATAAPRKQKKAKRTEGPAEATKPTRSEYVTRAFKSKIYQIKEHIASSNPTRSILTSSKDHEKSVLVDERALLGALCAMRADYVVSDPRMASVLDAEEAITERYYERKHAHQIRMVVLNISAPTPFEQAIREKIEDQGHSLDSINLLKVELELYMKQLLAVGKDTCFSNGDALATSESGHQAAETFTKSDHSEIADVESKEIERVGVCLRPVKDL